LTGHNKDTPRIVRIELTPVIIPFQEIVREAMSKSGGLGMAMPAEEAWYLWGQGAGQPINLKARLQN
jgi:hypothetical protein